MGSDGCNPKVNPDFYEESRYRFGGDDFGIQLPVDWLDVFKDTQGDSFTVKLTDENVELML